MNEEIRNIIRVLVSEGNIKPDTANTLIRAIKQFLQNKNLISIRELSSLVEGSIAMAVKEYRERTGATLPHACNIMKEVKRMVKNLN